MRKSHPKMRGVIDPMALGFLLSVIGSALVVMFEAPTEDEPPSLAQVCMAQTQTISDALPGQACGEP